MNPEVCHFGIFASYTFVKHLKPMRLVIVLLILSFSHTFVSHAQETAYKKQWLEIDTLIAFTNQTKTALEKIKSLQQKTKEQGAQADYIRSLLYQISLAEAVSEKNINDEIKLWEQQLALSPNSIEQSILHCYIANSYKAYFNANQWQITNRTNTATTAEKDIQTWTSNDFIKKIIFHYQEAIAPAMALQHEPISKWMPLISKGNYPELRPTLYDLIAHEALDFFKANLSYRVQEKTDFELSADKIFSPLTPFLALPLEKNDTLSRNYQALQLFQELLLFHTGTKNRAAILALDIERIQWLYQKFPNATLPYLNTLSHLQNQFNDLQGADEVYALLADYYYAKGELYQPFGDTTYRWDKVKSKKIIDDRIQAYPSNKTGGRYRMDDIKASIVNPSIYVETELVNIPRKPFRSLVKYKNIDTLYIRIIRASEATNKQLESKSNYNYWKIITSLIPEKEWIQALPNMGDFQFHSTEIKIPALLEGAYYLLFSKHQTFDSANNILASVQVQVSNLSLVNTKNDFFVLHRESGKPIAGATVHVKKSIWNGYGNTESKEKYTTNKYGQFSIHSSTYDNYTISVTYRNDSVFVGNSYLSPVRYSEAGEEEEEPTYVSGNRAVFYFKDRAIYRPGQTISFKGILIHKNSTTNNPISWDQVRNKLHKIIILLKDPNNKTIDTCKAIINDYGSFSGSFTLPTNTITGEFHLDSEIDNEQGSFFRVEEYKRPTFYASINKPKGNIQLGDSIAFTGLAKAYAGNAVDGATVSYTITRNARRNEWGPYYRLPRTNSVILKQGETKTDSEGKFAIDLIAIPDTLFEKKSIASFVYTVHAKITDTKGESKEIETSVSIGYNPLQLSITAPEIAEKDNLRSIFVYSKNQVGDDVPNSLKITIASLISNERLTRKRIWERPDVFVINREDFLKDFPLDEYDGIENDKAQWEQNHIVLTDSIHTGKTNMVDLTKLSLPQGWYAITVSAKDKNGKEVIETKYLQIFDRNLNNLPTPTYNWQYIIKNTAEPGEKANYVQASSAKNIFLIQYKNRDRGNKYYKNIYTFYELAKNKKEEIFDVTEKDRGGFTIHTVFVKDNRVYTYDFPVEVPWSNKDLKISVNSFRDKTEPGSKEKWEVKITGNKGEEVAAELLTGMYDASLDAFISNDWQLPSLWPKHYSYGSFNSLQSFISTDSDVFNENPRIYPYNLVIHNRLVLKPSEFWSRLKLPFTIKEEILEGKMAGTVTFNEGEVLNEVIVTGFGSLKQKSVSGLSDKIMIRGANSIPSSSNQLYIIDGEIYEGTPLTINPTDIKTMSILTPEESIKQYGERGAKGVVIITTKNGLSKLKDSPIQIRKNFNETAFFYPQLYADSNGIYRFEFTMPESVTTWKWQMLAQTKDLAFGSLQQKIITQKTLMVQTNVPRFLREGDNVEIVAKISNTSDAEITGTVVLELIDPQTNAPVDGWFQNVFPNQYFTAEKEQSTTVKFPIQIPFGYNRLLTWRVTAKSANAADGEQNIVPVLTNRMLITESLPLLLPNGCKKQFSFDKLRDNNSETLSHESITVEYTPNPIWTVVQSLPYLMEYPYECAEQSFNRYYANSLAAYIIQQNPIIKNAFSNWIKDSSSLQSNLSKNEELKQLLMQETPWVQAAENEAAQRKNIALLFDLGKMANTKAQLIDKLKQLQLENGAFSWFKGGREDFYITNYIVTGVGKLKKFNAIIIEKELEDIISKAISYLDNTILTQYKEQLKETKEPSYGYALEYLYMRSFFNHIPLKDKTAWDYYYLNAFKNWQQQSLYQQSLLGSIAIRNKQIDFVKKNILPSILENAVEDSTKGMYWKKTTTSFWYNNPIEFQSSLINFITEYNELANNNAIATQIRKMKQWLLLQKQTTHWKTTVATADACFSLLYNDTLSLKTNNHVTIQLGKQLIETDKEKSTAGTGYIKKRFDNKFINNDMGNITVTAPTSNITSNTSLSYGAVYWQYFENLDKITRAASPLSLEKKLFIEKTTATGKVLEPVQENELLKIGDKLIVRIILKSDRNMEYLHLKDMRASGTEPLNVLSNYKWQDGLGYYEATKDASTNFFISYLPKGTYVFEYPLFITHSGTFSVGIASIQCMYAPEFTSHSEGILIRVNGQ